MVELADGSKAYWRAALNSCAVKVDYTWIDGSLLLRAQT